MEKEPQISVDISLNGLIESLKKMPGQEREEFIENLIAATSPEYLESIREAREDYRHGRTTDHDEVFGKT